MITGSIFFQYSKCDILKVHARQAEEVAVDGSVYNAQDSDTRHEFVSCVPPCFFNI